MPPASGGHALVKNFIGLPSPIDHVFEVRRVVFPRLFRTHRELQRLIDIRLDPCLDLLLLCAISSHGFQSLLEVGTDSLKSKEN